MASNSYYTLRWKEVEFVPINRITVFEGHFGIFKTIIPYDRSQHWRFMGKPFIDSQQIIHWETTRGMLMKYPCGTKRFIANQFAQRNF